MFRDMIFRKVTCESGITVEYHRFGHTYILTVGISGISYSLCIHSWIVFVLQLQLGNSTACTTLNKLTKHQRSQHWLGRNSNSQLYLNIRSAWSACSNVPWCVLYGRSGWGALRTSGFNGEGMQCLNTHNYTVQEFVLLWPVMRLNHQSPRSQTSPMPCLPRGKYLIMW